MGRVEPLNKHLENLIALNVDGDYQEEIDSVLKEINRELGIGEQPALSTYATESLYNELVKRGIMAEITVEEGQEVVVNHYFGDMGQKHSFNGPVRVLVNQG